MSGEGCCAESDPPHPLPDDRPMIYRFRLAPQIRRWLGHSIVIGGMIPILAGGSLTPSNDEIFSGIQSESNRRHLLLKQYSGSREYTLQNSRFGIQAAATVLMNYREFEGERYTVSVRSGSEKLNAILDRVIASEATVSLPPENARYEITSANYRIRVLGTEVIAG